MCSGMSVRTNQETIEHRFPTDEAVGISQKPKMLPRLVLSLGHVNCVLTVFREEIGRNPIT